MEEHGVSAEILKISISGKEFKMELKVDRNQVSLDQLISLMGQPVKFSFTPLQMDLPLDSKKRGKKDGS